ncbi:MAG: hypothetical protein ACJKTH_00345 [Patescibacteria group bacterium UBA2163]
MSWSITRQLLIAFGALLIIALIAVGSFFLFFYTAPTCNDGVQNQNETGVDCGGICNLLCEQPNINALWSRSVRVVPGVYHAVALIKNPHTAAQGDVSYEVSLFDDENILITRRQGSTIILPGETVPLFEPNIITGERIPTRTFIDLEYNNFKRFERSISPVRTHSFNLEETEPRITAEIENQSTSSVIDVIVTALVFNDEDVLINASQTRVARIDPRQRHTVTFTWQEPFSEPVARVDIIPRVAP